LQDSAHQKVTQRRNAGLADYNMRDDSCRPRTIGTLRALSCIGDFTEQGKSMAEYLTWIEADGTAALFFARAPLAEFEKMRERLDPVIDAVQLQ
jgi:hypothetical protein